MGNPPILLSWKVVFGIGMGIHVCTSANRFYMVQNSAMARTVCEPYIYNDCMLRKYYMYTASLKYFVCAELQPLASKFRKWQPALLNCVQRGPKRTM